jgi:subtilisin family serine protease
MPVVRTCIAAALAGVALLLHTPAPMAGTLAVRAVGPHLPNTLIRYVARDAQPIALPPSYTAALRNKTASQTIRKLCGWVPKTYYAEFLAANRSTIVAAHRWPLPDSEKLGNMADKLIWPACLYVKNNPGLKPAFPTDTPRSVYIRLVGGDGTASTLAHFYGQEHESIGSVDAKIAKRRPVPVAWSTAPVTIAPKGNVSIADFTAGMDRAAATERYAANEVVRVVPRGGGRFVTDAVEDGAGGTGTPQCQSKGRVPYAPGDVVAAYTHSYEWQKSRQLASNRVDVVVVDNGFFGVDPTKQPYFSKPFTENYFSRWSRTRDRVGLPLQLDDDAVSPSNFLYPAAAHLPEAFHGTHVAGLVLGGAYLTDNDRHALFFHGNAPWLSMSMVNAGKGADSPIPGSLGRADRSFPDADRRIVNLSLMFFAKDDQTNAADVDRLISSGPNDLFVVAAGDGGGLQIGRDQVVPAADGGLNAPNVITVAGLDWSNAISAFSPMDPTFVDIAAPACGISSWIDNRATARTLSGTSQATPLVTFAAALLRSLDGDLTASAIKRRLIISGDPIVPRPDGSDIPTWSGMRLDIPLALYLFEDYIRFDRGDGSGVHEYLGALTDAKDVFCNGAADDDPDDIWSYKRDGTRKFLFTGRNQPRVQATPPCTFPRSTEANGKGQFIFEPYWEIRNGKATYLSADLKGKALPPLPLTAVQQLIRGIPL